MNCGQTYPKQATSALFMGVILVLSAIACSGSTPTPGVTTPATNSAPTLTPAPTLAPTMGSGNGLVEASNGGPVEYTFDVAYRLRTAIAEGQLAFIGVGGAIDGMVNPTLRAEPGQVVQITLINGDGAQHDIALPDFNAKSNFVTGRGSSSVFAFRASEEGEFPYFCTVPGHRAAGMEGLFVVGQVESEPTTAEDITRDPADLPPPVGGRPQETIRVDLEAVEVEGQLADGITYNYWTFDGKVPGPMIRVRVGDTVELHLKNAADSSMIHSIDLHAVTGPGGGAEVMQVPPGEEKAFTFRALQPGVYVYHCATPMVSHHISNGMYGLIVVEPEEGFPAVDREFYVMQGEVYTQGDHGQQGHQEFSVEKLLNEEPEYFVFNGSAGKLTTEHAMHVRVGETVRIFFGVGGPNFASSFHVIGEIFDRVYDQASVTAAPLTDVQTTMVPPGGATIVEFSLDVPGRYILVDHALARLERGLVGFLFVEGEEQPGIFKEGTAP